MKREKKESGPLGGLSAEQVLSSRDQHGKNVLDEEKRSSFFKKILENLNDPIIRVLLFAVLAQVIVTFGRCNWFEIGGILCAALIATVVSTVSEWGSEEAFLRMQREAASTSVHLLRGGARVCVPMEDVVVGDTVFLSSGERVPADGICIEGRFLVDVSALNGESTEEEKYPASPKSTRELSDPARVFRGSLVTSGEGKMVVDAVGENTYLGQVAKDVQTETRESPLKIRLAKLASQISRIGYVMAGIVAFTYLFGALVVGNGFSPERIMDTVRDVPTLVTILSRTLTLMITMIAVTVPEGLPMMITVVLASNVRRMARDGVLVKKMVGIETAGSMNMLFTDKTGTLTAGKLKVVGIQTQDRTYRTRKALFEDEAIFRLLRLHALCNTEAKFGADGMPFGGNTTERCLLSFFGEDGDEVTSVLEKVPFSSEKKYSEAIVRTEDGVIKLKKGAPEILLPGCRGALMKDGSVGPFDADAAEKIYQKEAQRGHRVIALNAQREGGDVFFLALISFSDPVRAGVRESVRAALLAGIRPIMITGDGLVTATAIAEECGIYKENAGNVALSADALHAMSDAEVKEILPRLSVIARSLPQDKVRLVKLAQECGNVVGMTGDGINDAPSLKRADVGFGMGSGTDVAKGAADIILMDDSFPTVIKTVLYGRTIFSSIRKFITFQLIMNFAACGVSLFGQFIGIEAPITIIQMLWVNIIMDTLGGLAFAGEAPDERLLRQKPKRREEPILSRPIVERIVMCGTFTLGLCMWFLTCMDSTPIFPTKEIFLTAFYALFIFSGIVNSFCARADGFFLTRGLLRNRAFLGIMSAVAVVQTLMIYFGGELFRTVPLSPTPLLFVLLLSMSVFIFDGIRRIFTLLRRVQ